MNGYFAMGLLLLKTYSVEAAIQPQRIELEMKPIVVAIVDTGVDIKHEILKDQIWKNKGEVGLDFFGKRKETNGIDDDKNGFIDDVHGWNFVDNNNDVFDDHGHGTHIAGIIKKEFHKESEKGTGRSGDKTRLQFMVLKYFSKSKKESGSNIDHSTRALQYALQMRADVVNYSGGGSDPSTAEFKVIHELNLNGVPFIAAAGNNQNNLDQKKFYPASYEFENIISVAATDRTGNLVGFSNFGRRSIDIAAPGHLVLSSLPSNTYGVLSGTSQATAHISGKVAYILFQEPLVRGKVLLDKLLAQGRVHTTLTGKTKHRVALVQD